MSPGMKVFTMITDGFPRVSGDEPLARVGGEADELFSPRERG